GGQTVPQLPQWLRSETVATQSVPHKSRWQVVQVPCWQFSFAAHARSHAPQWFRSVCKSKHELPHAEPWQHDTDETNSTVGICGSVAPPLEAVMILSSAVVDASAPVVTPFESVGPGCVRRSWLPVAVSVTAWPTIGLPLQSCKLMVTTAWSIPSASTPVERSTVTVDTVGQTGGLLAPPSLTPPAPPSLADVVSQTANKTVLESIVTAPFCASARPERLAPVVSVMLVSARMVPTKVVPVPRVAELPTCQKTLQPLPPLMTRTDAFDAVVSVLPIWKMKAALGSPCASSVSAPESCADDEKQ